MAERTTVVYPNPQILAEAVAARTLLTITDLLSEPNRTRVDIAVTGGTDGNRVFDAMNASPLNDAVDWSRVHVWWGDERFVAADDDDRNAKQAREAWYGKLVADGRMPAGNIHAMPQPHPNRLMLCWLKPPRNTSVNSLNSWVRIQLWTSPCSVWDRTRISHPCSPTMASRRSTIRMCLSPVCAIHRSRRHCA